jgi:hypothetical protein
MRQSKTPYITVTCMRTPELVDVAIPSVHLWMLRPFDHGYDSTPGHGYWVIAEAAQLLQIPGAFVPKGVRP